MSLNQEPSLMLLHSQLEAITKKYEEQNHFCYANSIEFNLAVSKSIQNWKANGLPSINFLCLENKNTQSNDSEVKEFSQYLQKQNKKREKKIKYIERHRTPKTSFNYHGIDIEVIYKSYQNFQASCLVIPVFKFEKEQIIKYVNDQQQCDQILQQINQYSNQSKPNEQFRKFYSKNIQSLKNYDWVYLVKKPIHLNLDYYSVHRLKQMTKNILKQINLHKKITSVSFCAFQWPPLKNQLKPHYFLYGLMEAITKQSQQSRMKLNKITICCENQKSFFQFTNKLRQISDEYIKSGIISV